MLVLVISDIHARFENLQQIVKLIHNKGVGLVLLLGDLTNLGGAKETEQALLPLQGFEVLAIPGNLDTPEVAKTLEEKGLSLHAKKKKLGQFTFVGFGGGLLGNPGGFLFSEEEIKQVLNKLMENEENVVLLTHLPPFGTKINLSSKGLDIGSKSVKEVVEKQQPLLHLCGHAHESFGEEGLGKTVSINVGAVKEGKAMLLELGEKPKWERLQI